MSLPEPPRSSANGPRSIVVLADDAIPAALPATSSCRTSCVGGCHPSGSRMGRRRRNTRAWGVITRYPVDHPPVAGSRARPSPACSAPRSVTSARTSAPRQAAAALESPERSVPRVPSDTRSARVPADSGRPPAPTQRAGRHPELVERRGVRGLSLNAHVARTARSAGTGTRTRTGLPPQDFKSRASTAFATPAGRRTSWIV